MSQKILPFTKSVIDNIIKEYPTPFHLYYERGIRENINKLISAFSWVNGFKEYYAVKANPNPSILKIMKDEGLGADCSSLPELILAEKVGYTGEDIMFSSNDTPEIEFKKAIELGAIINFDDLNHLFVIEECCQLPQLICFRYNPGPLRKGNVIIGNPEESKYGITKEQLIEGYRIAKEKGIKRYGLHTMMASNELNQDYLIETTNMLIDLVVDISRSLDINFEFINIGGGFGIPYKPEEEALDITSISEEIKKLYDKKIKNTFLHPLKILMENGRIITGPYGYLISKVLHIKETYKNYVGLDACMANLMRPAIYGAYHHITVLGKENLPLEYTCDLTGSLCENNDKFAIDRKLPKLDIGDIIVFHDTGAHGHAMGFNYNGKLRSRELMMKPDGKIKQIRRAETIEDYFATLDFTGL
ncbi:MAG: diaminopimelate decarboxylase [Spirochaetota bacterium]|nr:diaminopimelate decarboxylase [Spirochaetota bacterium]